MPNENFSEMMEKFFRQKKNLVPQKNMKIKENVQILTVKKKQLVSCAI